MIDLASMVLAPTAVKDGKVYNAIPNDQDFTFSRGTEATRVNSAGLIEKARTNYLLQSNTFDTTWGTSNASVTSGQTGYDGSNNAWLLQASGTFAYVGQTGLSINGVTTASVYIKAGTTNWVNFRIQASANNQIYVNVSNGTFGAVYASDLINKSIEDVGNGWYRVSVVLNVSSLSGFYIYVADDDNSLNTTNETVFIQSAQLEQGLVATDYIPTTTSSVTVGITDDLPRVDYSGGGCPSLLLEPSRTNLVTQSEYFASSDWTKLGAGTGDTAIVSTNYAISPEGLQNATRLQCDLNGGGTSSSNQSLIYDVYSGSGSQTISIYAKSNTGENQTIYFANTQTTGDTIIVTPEWQRFTFTHSSSPYVFAIGLRGRTGGAINDTADILIYGAMAESSASYVSSYIPTYGTSTSRSADTCSLTNASNLIGQSEGTLFVEVDLNHFSVANEYIIQVRGDASNRFLIYRKSDEKVGAFALIGGSTILDVFTTTQQSGIIKTALAYKSGDFAFYVDGVQVATSTNTYTLSVDLNRIDIDSNANTENGFFKYNQAILFPTRLTNDQLQELTK